MAWLVGIGREEVKQLITTLIFISIWHNDTECRERFFSPTKIQSLLPRGNTTPLWSLCIKRRWAEVGVVRIQTGSCAQQTQRATSKSSAFKQPVLPEVRYSVASEVSHEMHIDILFHNKAISLVPAEQSAGKWGDFDVIV